MPCSDEADIRRGASDRCIRCGYPLRGLPVRHACPDCGLRYDEHSVVYHAVNQHTAMLLGLVIFLAGPSLVPNLRHLGDLGAASAFDRVMSLIALVWVASAGYCLRLVWRSYTRGFAVAVLPDGLIVRMPESPELLIPWDDIRSVRIIERPMRKQQVAIVKRKSAICGIRIGDLANVFPNREVAEQFVAEVQRRVEAAHAVARRRVSKSAEAVGR